MSYARMFAIGLLSLSSLNLAQGATSPSGTQYISAPIAAAGTEGNPYIVPANGNIIATYLGGTAWYFNNVSLVTDSGYLAMFGNMDTAGTTMNLGSFVAGTELTFRLDSTSWPTPYERTWYSGGDTSLNADGQLHARIQDNWQSGVTLVSFEDLPYGNSFNYNDLSFSLTYSAAPVPEASTLLLSLAGLGLMGTYLRRRNQPTHTSDRQNFALSS
jgi:hypothetical protein